LLIELCANYEAWYWFFIIVNVQVDVGGVFERRRIGEIVEQNNNVGRIGFVYVDVVG
jgi:hypothetical protein